MSVWEWLKGVFGGKPDEAPGDVADRIDRVGDRFANAGDAGAEQAARIASADARRCATADEARAIERAFYKSRGLRPDGRPAPPVVGQAEGGPEYVRHGDRVRAGGSRSWRYNNPGYVRCSSRSGGYGAIGCDGEYAIFPDERTGIHAFARELRTEYPDRPLGEALRQQLPAAEADAVAGKLQQAGYDLGAAVGSFAESQLAGVGETIRDGGDWQPGEVIDRDGTDTAPTWVESVWSAPDPTVSETADYSGGGSYTDNS